LEREERPGLWRDVLRRKKGALMSQEEVRVGLQV
jgi:hypothetical protein